MSSIFQRNAPEKAQRNGIKAKMFLVYFFFKKLFKTVCQCQWHGHDYLQANLSNWKFVSFGWVKWSALDWVECIPWLLRERYERKIILYINSIQNSPCCRNLSNIQTKQMSANRMISEWPIKLSICIQLQKMSNWNLCPLLFFYFLFFFFYQIILIE